MGRPPGRRDQPGIGTDLFELGDRLTAAGRFADAENIFAKAEQIDVRYVRRCIDRDAGIAQARHDAARYMTAYRLPADLGDNACSGVRGAGQSAIRLCRRFVYQHH